MENGGNGWLVALLIGGLIWAIFFHESKFEGMTAEEWYYEYDASETDYQNLHDCVENSVSYYGFEDYEDLQYQLDDIEGCL